MSEIKTIDIQNDWEKRFDELFESLSRCGRTEKDFGKNTIRDFIRNLLADSRTEERMKAEIETGLKNFQVTMEEISKARKEVMAEIWKQLDKKDRKLIEWDSVDKKNSILTSVFRLQDIGDVLATLREERV